MDSFEYHYLVIKVDGVLSYATTWLELEVIYIK